MRLADLNRFLKHVDFEGTQIPGMQLRCWEWMGAPENGGRLWFFLNGSGRLAKRALFEILTDAELSSDCTVASLCGNRKCVRPEHLFLCNENDAQALGQLRRIGPGNGAMFRQLVAEGYAPEELAVAQEISVALISAYVNEQIGP